MPIPIDLRKKPIDVKIHVSTGKGVDVTWSDGHTSHYEFAYLRHMCPCALCNDEREKNKNFGGQTGGSPLPMFKPKVTAKGASAVGSYAVQIQFSDGHTTGIYSFEHLREICPCERCAAEFRSAAAQRK